MRADLARNSVKIVRVNLLRNIVSPCNSKTSTKSAVLHVTLQALKKNLYVCVCVRMCVRMRVCAYMYNNNNNYCNFYLFIGRKHLKSLKKMLLQAL